MIRRARQRMKSRRPGFWPPIFRSCRSPTKYSTVSPAAMCRAPARPARPA
jgi:hypothetical protein